MNPQVGSSLPTNPLFNQHSGSPQQQHADQDAGENGYRHGLARRVLLDQLGDFVNHFEDRPGANRQEEHRQGRRRRKSADPGANDRRGAAHQPHQPQLLPGRPVSQDRGDDPQPFGNVLEDETHHQERPQGDLTHIVSGPNRKPLPQVVQANPRGNHISQR